MSEFLFFVREHNNERWVGKEEYSAQLAGHIVAIAKVDATTPEATASILYKEGLEQGVVTALLASAANGSNGADLEKEAHMVTTKELSRAVVQALLHMFQSDSD